MINVLPLLFVILTLAQFKRADSIWFWKFSVLATELAHLAIPLLIIWAFWAYAKARRKPKRPAWPIFFLFVLFLAVFLRPVIEGYKVARAHDLEISPMTLFAGADYDEVKVSSVKYHNSIGGVHDDLTFDVYQPRNLQRKSWLMVVHGGGWDSGDSSQIAHFNHRLASQLGMTVFSVNYGLSPSAVWPKPTQDVADAILYIQSHATDYSIDAFDYFILGRSAGGQIAGELSYNSAHYKLAKPAGAILFYTPSDLLFGYEVGEENDVLESRGLIRQLISGSRDKSGAPDKKMEPYIAASPISHLQADSPPTLIIHGQHDSLVWYKHSERLQWRLSRLGVANRMILLPWATHGFDFFMFGPGGQIAVGAVERFIVRGKP